MPSPTILRLSNYLQIIGLILFTITYVVFINSNYLNYAAEGIFLNGLLRLLEGKDYLTTFNEIPTTMTCYFPTAYLFYYPWGKLFDIHSAQSLASLVRSINGVYLVIYIFITYKLLSKISSVNVFRSFLATGILIFFCKEFTNILSFKPDFHSQFIELIAFLMFLIFQNKKDKKWLVFSALLFAFATVIKANMIGIGVGAALSLLVLRNFKDLIIFCSVGITTLAIGILSVRFWMGADLFSVLLETTASDLISAHSAVDVIRRVSYQIVFPYLIFLFLAFHSTFFSRTWNREQKFAITIALVISSILAFMGQFKYGAETNYFYSTVLLAIIVASLGMVSLTTATEKNSFSILSLAILVVVIGNFLLFPIQITLNDKKNYDFKKALEFIDAQFENPRIFSEHNNASAHLAQRAVLPVGFFNFFNATQSIRNRLDTFKSRLNETHIDAWMVTVSNCQQYSSQPAFPEIGKKFPKLIYQDKKICIFGKE